MLHSERTVIDETFAPWPEPEDLGDELPAVLTFDAQLLPASFRPIVLDVSERMQTPLDFAAATAVNVSAACVGWRVFVEPKAYDPSFRKPCNLWGALIGPPGILKSPLIEAITRPLSQIEDLWREEYKTKLSAYELHLEEADLRRQAWRDSYRAAYKRGQPQPLRPDTSLSPPPQRRLILQDSTFEKLHEILVENPSGVFVLRDELTGWFSELDRPGREGERAFYLTGWNGTTGHAIDRIGRGSVYVPAVCISLFGGIQPARLRTYLRDALEGGPSDDGLIQRFQVLVWPDPGKWVLVDRPPDAKAEALARQVFERLVSLPAHEPRILKFSAPAQELHDAWLKELETAKLRSRTLHPALVAHFAKYRSLMPVLAALFELSDWAAGLGGDESISLDHTQQAAGFCEYLESHGRRVYSCILAPELRAARELAVHIAAGELGREKFTVRQVYRHHWSGLVTPTDVRGAVDILEDAHWVRPLPDEKATGRPPETYSINPRVVKR